ncbi:hypothetical protein NSND_61449 [Nitrospira sp. ND1]|nr:hypothetical protein NSND_61449 [Nitrospira sp. ND1]
MRRQVDHARRRQPIGHLPHFHQDQSDQLRPKDHSTTGRPAHRIPPHRHRRILQHIPLSARSDRLPDDSGVVVHAQNEHPRVRPAGDQPTAGLHTRPVRQTDIQQHQVWIQPFDQLKTLRNRRRLADNTELRRSIQLFPQAKAGHAAIINQNNAIQMLCVHRRS